MITSRNHLLATLALLAFAFGIATAWLAWTDHVAAQQNGSRRAKQKAPELNISGVDLDAGEKLPERAAGEPKDLTVMRFLDSRVSIEPTMGNVSVYRFLVEIMADKAGKHVPIILNKPDLKDAMVDLEEMLDYEAQKLKVRMVLRKVLRDRFMDYYLDEGLLRITSKDKLLESPALVVKIYPLDNILQPDLPSEVQQMPGASKAWADEAFTLKQTIELVVEPNYWMKRGGPGKILYDPLGHSFLIECSQEVHYLLAASGLLANAPVDGRNKLNGDVIRVYSLAGLIDHKKPEQSRADLETALKLVIPERVVLTSADGTNSQGTRPAGLMFGGDGGLPPLPPSPVWPGGTPGPPPPGGGFIVGGNSADDDAKQPMPAATPILPGLAVGTPGHAGMPMMMGNPGMGMPDQAKPKPIAKTVNTFSILVQNELLVIRQPPAVQERVETLLRDMKTLAKKAAE